MGIGETLDSIIKNYVKIFSASSTPSKSMVETTHEAIRALCRPVLEVSST
jgi:hypothetical protein